MGPRRLFILYGLNLLVMMTKVLGFGELVNFLVGFCVKSKAQWYVRLLVVTFVYNSSNSSSSNSSKRNSISNKLVTNSKLTAITVFG